MSKEQYRTVFYFNFILGQSAAETARQINLVWGPNSVGESSVQQWFKKFRTGDFNLEDAPRSGRPTVIPDDNLKTLVEADPSQTVRGIAKELGISHTAVADGLKRIGKVKKLEKWVPHDVNDQQKLSSSEVLNVATTVQPNSTDIGFVACNNPVQVKQEVQEDDESKSGDAEDVDSDGFDYNPEITCDVSIKEENDEYFSKCGECKKMFRSKSELEIHKEEHTKKSHSCKTCGKEFKFSSWLKIHMRKHSTDRPVLCDHCGKGFTCSSNLKQHIKKHSPENTFKCEYCDRIFHNPLKLTDHVRIHTGEKPFLCTVCNKAFRLTIELTRHLKEHTEKTKFQCEFCQMSFNRVFHLRAHIRTHTGEKPFVCEICKKTFSQSSNLTSHLKTHTGEKSFVCETCDKAFTTAAHLARHVKTHEGKNLLQCHHCQKTFNQSWNLTKHLKIHEIQL